ncbi:MAG: prephenate dehydrogenase [Actinomycetaceae bacterium]|nr:prephenate dehydrogenase [Actinomycetaceae bacterium]
MAHPVDSQPIATAGRVVIIGSGLLGTSIALLLRAKNVEVYLEDASPVSLALACDLGGGQAAAKYAGDSDWHQSIALAVIAVPPDVTAPVTIDALKRFPNAVVTDVASVKTPILNAVLAADVDHHRYVPSHPMAGRERSGASAADQDLFRSRPWVVINHPKASKHALLTVRDLALDCGASVVNLDATEHDRAVAIVSHVPQLVSSLLAARLVEAPEEALGLIGQGLRDTTRIANSDPRLWNSIICGNRGPISSVLTAFAKDLSDLLSGLTVATDSDFGEAIATPGCVGAVNSAMQAGNEGAARIPGKHGGAPRRWSVVAVLVPDKPGELGRLFTDLGAVGINIEDFSMDHSAYQRVGTAYLSVDPAQAAEAEGELAQRGWRIVKQ